MKKIYIFSMVVHVLLFVSMWALAFSLMEFAIGVESYTLYAVVGFFFYPLHEASKVMVVSLALHLNEKGWL